jgi:hypothetical protein
MTLLQERDEARCQRRLQAFAETRARLKSALATLIPGHKVILFGSLTKPGVFNDRSDVDPDKLAMVLKYARQVAAQLPSLAGTFVRHVAEEQQIALD